MVFMLNVHPSRSHDLLTPDAIRTIPMRSITPYLDGFANKCLRVLAPPGEFCVFGDSIISDSGLPDRVDLGAEEHAVPDLPHGAHVSARESLLRKRSTCGQSPGVVRQRASRMATRARNLRFRRTLFLGDTFYG
jgi:hypothetical protein